MKRSENSIEKYPLMIKNLVNSKAYKYCLTNLGDDDTAILEFPGGYLVTTTDFINYRPAFMDLKCGDLYDYGYLVTVANFSDLYGTGAKPYAFSVGIRLLRHHAYKDYKRFMNGVVKCCRENDVPLVAGDTKIGNELCAVGTALGYVKSYDGLFTRDKAQPGDVICISGPVGGFNCAVSTLSKKEKMLPARKKVLIDAIVRPRLDKVLSLELSNKKVAKGGIDLSDGLGGDLYKLATASKVGAIIHVDKIPVPSWVKEIAQRAGDPPWFYAFTTGGDYKFIFTADKKKLNKIKSPFYEIGYITKEKKLNLQLVGGENITLPNVGHSDTGFHSFKSEVKQFMNELRKRFRKC